MTRLHSAAIYLVLFAAAGAGAAQQKYRLAEKSAPGDHSVNESVLVMTMKVRSSLGEQELPEMTLSNRKREKYTEEVVAVDAKGATSVRRAYAIAREVDTDPAGARKEKVSSLQGKSLTVRRLGTKVTITAAKGKLADEDRKDLIREFENGEIASFPDYDVGAGDEWKLDPQAISRSFTGADKAEVKARFQEVVAYGGHQCALLKVDMQIESRAPDLPGPMRIHMIGDVYYAIDLQKTLAMDVFGPVSMTADIPQDGKVIKLAGEGTLHLKLSSQWLKVRGKKVIAKP